ncbi:hypothetical protein D3C78_1323180 [compost metagenome]
MIHHHTEKSVVFKFIYRYGIRPCLLLNYFAGSDEIVPGFNGFGFYTSLLINIGAIEHPCRARIERKSIKLPILHGQLLLKRREQLRLAVKALLGQIQEAFWERFQITLNTIILDEHNIRQACSASRKPRGQLVVNIQTADILHLKLYIRMVLLIKL